MSDYIVLVKQVPDITQITDDAFDHDTGTLIRSRLAGVINQLDTQALAFANHMKQISSDKDARIICLTMGPPAAEAVLKYTLSRCAQKAILLTDKALGGADTWATANSLAGAVRKTAEQILNNTHNYYILTGMQSVDGDTAQVPPQLAEELSIGCIPYVTDVRFENNDFEFTRIISGGNQTVKAKNTPVVITVAKYDYPLFATFERTRKANRTAVIRWGAEEIKAVNIGAKGSKTSVIRIFSPEKSKRKSQQAATAEQLAQLIIKAGQAEFTSAEEVDTNCRKHYILPAERTDKFDRTFEATEKENSDFGILNETLKKLAVDDINKIDSETKQKILDAAGKHFHKMALEDMLCGLKLTTPTYTGQVWTIAEHHNGRIHPAALELTAKAAELALDLGTKAGVCLAGDNVEPMTKQLFAAGADIIYLIEDEILSEFDHAAYRKVICDAIKTYEPQIVLLAATCRGRVLAPMVSYRLGCGLTADCTSLEIKDRSRTGDIAILMQTRPALGGNVMATICTKDSNSQMATVRGGVMKKPQPDYSRSGEIIKHKIELCSSDIGLEIVKTEPVTSRVDLSTEVIVSGGKGMKNRDNYERLVGGLCRCLREKLNKKVERGASRAAVEYGFIERQYQIGQSGTAVRPKLYIALGISGAIQHMTGIANSQTIIAVNSDRNAPVLKQCDYYIVGNVEKIVPELIRQLNKMKLQNTNS